MYMYKLLLTRFIYKNQNTLNITLKNWKKEIHITLATPSMTYNCKHNTTQHIHNITQPNTTNSQHNSQHSTQLTQNKNNTTQKQNNTT